MKRRTFLKWSLGVCLAISTLAGARQQAIAVESVTAPANDENQSSNNVPAQASALAADTDAPAVPVTTEKPLPANIKPSGPVAEVIKLANSGLDESVMLAYVTNSTHTFNLSAEDIIYLNDIGVPGKVVTAMIQQDQALKTALAAGASATGAGPPDSGPNMPAPGTEAPAQLPGPEQVAPQYPEPAAPVEAPLAPPEDGSMPMFYDTLAPYGTWVDIAGYGRCWQPTATAANPGWQPYFDCGHWVYSDCGWYWLSDYSWGWAPFHYGSWFRHARLGWCWVPGTVWGPSWVCWRYNDDYCGWAPLPPGAGFAAGVGLTFHGHGVWDRDDFGLRPSHYHFVAWNHFNDRQLRPYALPPREVAKEFKTSTVASRIVGDGHTVINNGLPPSRVAAATHRPVHTVSLREVNSPTGGGRAEHFEAGGQSLAVYRPNPSSPEIRGNSTQSTTSSTAPWTSRTGTARLGVTGTSQQTPTARPAAPLILRGAQSSALRESPPASSLIIIGRGNSARSAAPAQSWSSTPSAARAASATAETAAQPAVPQPNEVPRREGTANRPATVDPQRNWTGMVSSSPRPSWFGATDQASPRQFDNVPVPRAETWTYQPATRPDAPEVPRYAPAPTYTPQRSYSSPSWSAPARSSSYEARPAPSAPSVPSAQSAPPAVSHSAPSAASTQSSNRGGR